MMWIAWKLPRRLVYWAGIRLTTEASHRYSKTPLPDITAMDAVNAWWEE
jgi:hypothetical protein